MLLSESHLFLDEFRLFNHDHKERSGLARVFVFIPRPCVLRKSIFLCRSRFVLPRDIGLYWQSTDHTSSPYSTTCNSAQDI